MKIIDWINNKFSTKIYDEYGRLSWQRLLNRTERWYEYVDGGYIIRTEYPSGKEKWMAFDSNSTLLYVREEDGGQMWFDYKPDGLSIHTKYENGKEEYFTYDSRGILIEVKTIIDEEVIKTKIQTSSEGSTQRIETDDTMDELSFYPDGKIKESISISKNKSFRTIFNNDGKEIVKIESIGKAK